MSNLAASNTKPSLQEDIHRALSSLLSFVRKLLTGLLSFCLLLSKYIRQAINFINRNPNKPHEILASKQSSLLFLSLPNDVLFNCLARVPRQNYPIISHVSKSFRALVLSPELRQMRFLIGNDYPIFYICFYQLCISPKKYHWFSFDPNEKTTSYLKGNLDYSSSVSIGSKIYFVGGYNYTSQNLWIFDSWSNELCKGPNMKVGRRSPGVTVVDGKLYVIGGYHQSKMEVEVFDPKTQTWEFGPVNPYGEFIYQSTVMEAVSIKEKIYGTRSGDKSILVYNTKDARYGKIEMPYNEDARKRFEVCVINNVMYVYYRYRGLMWYDTKAKLWRMVKGLKMFIHESVTVMVECKGKLGFFWQDTNRIWCARIVLDRNGVEIHGTIEWSVLVKYVPYSYALRHCLSVSN